MLCVITVSYSVCFNGSQVWPIFPWLGLRQGDHLSPYLFLFCVEGLSYSINEAAVNGKIHGCQVSSNAPSTTHLLFVDDIFLFFKATRDETMKIKKILKKYESLSGQSINFYKSGIF